MTHRGPFQPLLFCDSVGSFSLWQRKPRADRTQGDVQKPGVVLDETIRQMTPVLIYV